MLQSLRKTGDTSVKKISAAVVAAFLTAPTLAQAQAINPQPGIYVGAGGGAAWHIGSQAGAPTSTGWAPRGLLGYDLLRLRRELHRGHGQNPTHGHTPR